MNTNIAKYGKNWTAGDNSIVELYYKDKKQIYGEAYNLFGYDYYKEGVFELFWVNEYEECSDFLVHKFDWRYRHDACDSASYYFEDNDSKTGWLTSVKDQNSPQICKSCWAFGSVGSFEAIFNLYYNEHYDFDFSEQELVSTCCMDCGDCDGGEEYKALDYIANNGLITENCFKYQALSLLCTDTGRCSNPDTIAYLCTKKFISRNPDSLRKALIENGPLTFSFKTGGKGHTVVLVGYYVDPSDSSAIWVLKENAGPLEGENGFIYLKLTMDRVMRVYGLVDSVYISESPIDVNCYDKDNDGYYWWGIGPKPDSCPDCPDQRDSNDNDPFLGPFDSCYYEICNYEYSAEFSNNISGIFLSGLSNSAVNHNSFNIIPGLVKTEDTVCGLYLESCTGYQVEENRFKSNYYYVPGVNNNKDYIGLYIKNSGTANNEIYNNYFNNNYYATIVEGVNRGDTTGLCIKCNDYRYNMNDIFVVPNTSLRGLRLEQGIAEYQGSLSDSTTTGPAGNTFTVFENDPDTMNVKYFNYLNDTTEYFNYLHHDYSIEYPRVYPKNVNDSTELIIFHYMNLDYEKEQSCPSSFNQGGGIGSLQSMIALEEYQIEALETDIGSTVDGGSTSNLLNEIQNSNPSHGNTLRQQLISYSPYLSDTVVALSIEKENVLPNPFMRDIMLANPHSGKKEKLVSKIDSRNTQMPAYMKQEINNAKYNLDALDLLLSKKRTRENKKDKLLNSLIRLYLCDTNIQNPFDSIKILLENEQTFNRKIELAYLALQQNDSTEARNIINNIENCFSLSSLEDSILFYYDKFIEILIHQKSNQKADVCIDSLATLDLLQMYHKKLPTISNYAGNLLQAAGKLNKKERYYFPINPNTKSTKNTFLPFDYQQNTLNFKLIPNPAKNWVMVDYENDSGNNPILLEVHGSSGQKLKSIKLFKNKDQVIVNTEQWPAGIYIFRLTTNKLSASRKLIVLK